jgi:Mg2+-importing ATPase
VAVTPVVPFLPFAPLLGLTPLPPLFLGLVAVIVTMYIVSGELAKRIFYRHFDPTRAARP